MKLKSRMDLLYNFKNENKITSIIFFLFFCAESSANIQVMTWLPRGLGLEPVLLRGRGGVRGWGRGLVGTGSDARWVGPFVAPHATLLGRGLDVEFLRLATPRPVLDQAHHPLDPPDRNRESGDSYWVETRFDLPVQDPI